MRSSSACRRQFKRLDILPILCQYTFSLMISIVDNLEIFQTKPNSIWCEYKKQNLTTQTYCQFFMFPGGVFPMPL